MLFNKTNSFNSLDLDNIFISGELKLVFKIEIENKTVSILD